MWNVRFKPTLLIEESLMKECRASVGRSSHSVEQIPLENRWEYSLKLIVAVFSLRGHSQTRFTKFGFFWPPCPPPFTFSMVQKFTKRASVGPSSHSVEQRYLEKWSKYSMKLIVAVFSLSRCSRVISLEQLSVAELSGE